MQPIYSITFYAHGKPFRIIITLYTLKSYIQYVIIDKHETKKLRNAVILCMRIKRKF